MIHRRTFFKTGLIGAVMLGGAYSISQSFKETAHPTFSFFTIEDLAFLNQFCFVILKGTGLTKENIPELLSDIEKVILGLPPTVQMEVRELLLLFKFRPGRWLMGRNSPWSEASIEEIEVMLGDLKLHRLAVLRSAYSALCELVNASFYANSKNWEAIGYPGPLELNE